MRVLSPLCSLRGCNIFACSVCRGGVVLPMQTGVRRRGFCRAMASHTLAVVWYVTYLCLVRVLPSPISYRVVLVTAYFSVRCLA